MGLPTLADHIPVRSVAVHGNVHASAAGSNAVIETLRVDLFQVLFKRDDVIKSGCFRNIASIQQNMETDGFDALLFRLFHHAFEVVDMAVHIAVGK